jgi:type I restriction enzyme, S subunit
VLPPTAAVLAKFVYYFIRQETYRRAAESEMTGSVGQKRVPADFLKKTEIALPPVAEQKRIVAKVKELLARANTSREHLLKTALILKRFRQAVLAAACSGGLTQDWRETHPSVEPAARFLERIDNELRGAKGEGEKNRFLERDEDEDGELPNTWVKSSLGRIFSVETGATPLRRCAAYYQDGTIPWMKTAEVHNSEIWEANEFITPLALRETNVKVFPAGTILIAMYGEGKTRGQVGRLRIEAATNQACAALVNTQLPTETLDYVYSYCLSQYNRLRRSSFGGNQPNLSLGVIKGWSINVPPLEEQDEIAHRVAALFELADIIEERVAAATKRADRLTQAILAKAFRGDLVPTEAELARREGRAYEPASTLLERIRAARETKKIAVSTKLKALH